jgi:hypothetical protein
MAGLRDLLGTYVGNGTLPGAVGLRSGVVARVCRMSRVDLAGLAVAANAAQAQAQFAVPPRT